VVFISVGYGKDKEGSLYMQIGPLAGEAGYRRLNVAVTRAKEHVKVISSILSTDIPKIVIFHLECACCMSI